MKLDTLQLLSVGHVRPNRCWGMPPHCHQFHELIVVIGGAMRVHTPTEYVIATAGDLLFYGEGVLHEEHSDEQMPVETLFISFRWPDAVPTIPLRAQDRQGRVTAMVRWLHEDRFATSSVVGAVRDALSRTLVAEFLRLVAYAEPDLVRQTRRYIRAHVADELSLEELAAQAQMSRFHFARTYKHLAEHTPMDDVRRIRVETARDLLLTTDLPLKAIAARTGFANTQHLARLVRQYLNYSPSEIRKHVPWDVPPEIEEHG